MDNLESTAEFNDHEIDVLVRLLVRMAAIDGDSSSNEYRNLQGVAQEVGIERFGNAVDLARREPCEEEDLLSMAKTVRVAARPLFVKLLADISKADGVKSEEDAFFRRIIDAWRTERPA